LKKSKSDKIALVLWGATDLGPPHFSADMLWRTGFKAPDPFILAEINDKAFLLVGPLELERAAKETNSGIEVVNYYDYVSKSRDYLINFLKKQDVFKIVVQSTFPCELCGKLLKHFQVAYAKPPFYPRRAVKADWEIQEIERAQRAVEIAVSKAVDFLRVCKISGDKIVSIYQFETMVTSEFLRKIIDISLYEQGYLGIDTIVSSGLQAADPHCAGFGPLYAHQPIVMDVFPLSLKTHYYADMTRTVFKGKPSQAMENMYETVRSAQALGINQIRAGIDGLKIYNWTLDYFKVHGYPTELKSRPMEGFIHGVGHGVGIDIHEPPTISSRSDILRAGNVVTIEPGLYYQQARGHIPAGGIRIEDMVLVTENGYRNLTKFPKDL